MSTSATATPAPHPPAHTHRSWAVATAVSAVMVLLALLGVGLTTANSAAAKTYWISLVPVFGLLCIGTAWARGEKGHGLDRDAIFRQALHWAGTGIALALDFYIRSTGDESSAALGLNALLVLSLGCFLAGVHLQWLFIPVGALLTVTLVVVAKANQYVWLVFVLGGLTLAGLLGAYWMVRKVRHHHAAPAAKP